MFLFMFLFFLSFASAKDNLILRTNQSEYYFLIGQEALIPLEIKNNYKEIINGLMAFTTTSKISQGNMQYSSSNSNSKSFTAEAGNQVLSIGLGNSNNPSEVDLGIEFSYSKPDGEVMIATMPMIKVYFVQDSSQQENKKNEQKSSSESQEERQKQEQKEAQKQMDEQMKQQQNQNQMQNRLQNNQMNQNTQNLKKQMESQQQMQKEFAENLASNPKFAEKHKEMLEEGYNIKNEDLNAVDKENGDFRIGYENKNGEKASLEGEMENGSISEMETTEDREVLDILNNDSRFQNYESMLEKEGFEMKNYSIERENNKTNVEIKYLDEKNETAVIMAEVEDGGVKDIELDKDSNFSGIYIFGLLLLGTAGLLYLKKRRKPAEIAIIDEPVKRLFDYKREANKMLKTSKKLFDKEDYKEAYAKASESVRFYYVHKLKINKEITTNELTVFLRQKGFDFKAAQKCLNLCGLVEFAKYKPNKNDFDEILEIARKIIK